MANRAKLDLAEFAWAADQVEVALRRAHPSEVEKDELADEAHLNATEMRAALEILRQRGVLNENGEHFAILLEGERPEQPPAPAEEGETVEEHMARESPEPSGWPRDRGRRR